MRLFQITAGYFCAGFELGAVVIRAAPIIKYMRGWSLASVQAYCARRHWRLAEVDA